MKLEPGSALLGLLGLIVLRLAIGSSYLLYVKAQMRPWLLLAGGFLLLAAFGGFMAAKTRERNADRASHHLPGPAWLLWIPIALIVAVPSAPLGSFTAARQTVNPRADFGVADLPEPRDGAIDMNIAELIGRVHNYTETIDGVPIRLLGFVGGTERGAILLTRFWMSCCAADSFPIQVRIEGKDGRFQRDSWIEIVGTWRKPTGRSGEPDDLPIIDASSVTPTGRPSNPYAN